MASPEPSAAGAGAGGESATASQAAAVEPIRMPTVEEIKGQDIWNNCAVRSVVSGVMGPHQIMLEFEEEHAHGGRW